MKRLDQEQHSTIKNQRKGAFFLDRDGVINHEKKDYVKHISEFKFIQGAIEGIRLLSTLGLPIVIITNQSAVGRGLLSLGELDRIHKHMTTKIQEGGGKLAAIYFCPHLPEDHCVCRKPNVGLFKQAEKDLTISLQESWFIGDKLSDDQAGKAAGCKTVLIESNIANALLKAANELSESLGKGLP